MSVLVETQGEMLDQIEYSVQQAHAYVEKGVKQLEKAKQSQKDSRKVTTKIA
jgi:t-SNARE complex subunit (syntaxin)